MNHQIGPCIGRKLPEVTGHPEDVKPFILHDPLSRKLSPQLGGITHGKNNPPPPGILRDAQQEVPTDESRGTGDQKLHVRRR